MSLAILPDLNAYLIELARQATERSMKNPIKAEILAGAEPAWHILVVESGRERTAARHLIERGFGIYLPEFQKTTFVRDCVKRRRMCLMFPSYLPIFVWGIERQWGRIATCPGIMRALAPPGSERAMVIPDRIIDHIQAAETELFLHGGIVQRGHVVEPKKKRKRRQKKRAERIKDLDLPAHIELAPNQELVTISTKSYFAGVGGLDGPQRNSLLHRALGLPL